MRRIVPLSEREYPDVMEMHREMGLDYELDLERPDFIIKNAMYEDERLVSVVLGRLTTEAYLLLDKKWATPQERLDAVQRLVKVSANEAKLNGIVDTHVWCPPKAQFFVRRLKKMGFVEDNWPCLTARL